MPYFFNKTDALLISLKKSDIFSRTIPGKTQAYMPSGKPILTNADGEVSRIINEAQCGLTANSGDYKTLSKNILKSNPFLSCLMWTHNAALPPWTFEHERNDITWGCCLR